MEFTVPQFIEKETRIVGPFSFKQLVVVGIGVALCIMLYFNTPFAAFIIIAPILLVVSFALSFLKINRTPLPNLLKNIFIFVFKPKVYLWKKKSMPPKFISQRKFEEVKKEDEKLSIGITKGGRLKQLYTTLETKNRQNG